MNVLTLEPRQTRVTLGSTPAEASSWDFVVDGQSVLRWPGMSSGLPTFRFESGPYRRLVSGA